WGGVDAGVLRGGRWGLGRVAIVGGGGIARAIGVTGAIGGAHLTPAVTLSLASWGRFSWSGVIPYVISQLAGAMLAAATLYVLFSPYLAAREKELGLVRGQPGSELTAMCYGEYFPNPQGVEGPWRRRLVTLTPSSGPETPAELEELIEQNHEMVSEGAAFLAEFLGTLILALVIFAVTDPANSAAPQARLAPVFIGLTVAIL